MSLVSKAVKELIDHKASVARTEIRAWTAYHQRSNSQTVRRHIEDIVRGQDIDLKDFYRGSSK